MVGDTIIRLGLTPGHQAIIDRIFSQYPHVEEAVVFGSRAKGNYKPGSDIDFAIKGSNLTREDLCSLAGAFEASLLPFFVDLLSYSSITNPDLKAHIDRVGVTIYKQ
ncbi:nucleotidyltransferase domain-containing protein [uncultured Parabacteroides sp.]|uniref:nucleotidyltransferase family protein n=1 Tax=uncultured Parabacteroides sp. TaxID=512312 RepID=UPI0026069D98|nr:nucleotidyltransferase domain-containing protein [uncultured Parabacteroides sp.]